MFQGRIGVKDYWRAYAIGLAVNLSIGAVNSIFKFIPSSLSFLALVIFILFLVPYLIFALASLGLVVRRLHDLNLSGWWSLFPLSVIALSIIPKGLFIIGVVVFILVFLGLFVYISFFPGKKKENKYGAPAKYDSWSNAYLGNKQSSDVTGLRYDEKGRKISFDAILLGALVDIGGTSLLSIPLVIYLMTKYHLTLDSIPQLQNLLVTDPIASVVGWTLGSAFSVLGGYVAARIAKHHLLLNAGLASFICMAATLISIGKVPLLYTLIGLFATPILALIGGYIRLIQMRNRIPKN